MPRRKIQTYTRARSVDMDAALQRVEAELGEWVDDYVVIVRTRNPEAMRWMYTNVEWANGALSHVQSELP